jgi:hypothetical protein
LCEQHEAFNNLTMQQVFHARIGWAGNHAASGVSAQQPSPAQPPPSFDNLSKAFGN